MKEQYISPNIALVLLQSAQSLANSDISFDSLKDPNYTGPGSVPLADVEIDLPI